MGGTATLGTDYIQTGASNFSSTTGKVTFVAGSATADVVVNPKGETTEAEPNETVIFTLASGTGYTIGTTTAVTGTIIDDEPPLITLAVSPSSVTENGAPNLVYTFTRTGLTTSDLTVNFNVGGTATFSTDYTQTGSSNFNGTSGKVTFAAGSATAEVEINPKGETTEVEADETVVLTLASGTGYSIGTTTAVTGTILNDDFPDLSINDITVVEGKDTKAFLTVSVSSPLSQPISVKYTTTPINATANTDYTTTTGTLTLAANATLGTIAIPLLNDNLNEPDEAFTVTLSNPVNANLGPDSIGEVIISDTWQSTITRTLPKDVENLKLIGNNAINGTGNTANNVLTGNSADNTLAGLEGDDTYAFAANSPLGVDTITETLAGGIDTLDFTDTNAAIRLNLGSSTNQTVVTGNLTLKLSAIDVIENARGGSGNDRITGNSLKNSLFGNGGNDTLNGGLDDDYLAGMTGDDLLSGASGKDSFAYVTAKTFLAGDIGLDTLTDFTPTTDKVILSKATFKALTSGVGNGFSQGSDFAVVEDDALAATSTAFMVYSSNSGSLFYNQNGSASGLGTGAEFAVLSGIPTLTGNDFTLVA